MWLSSRPSPPQPPSPASRRGGRWLLSALVVTLVLVACRQQMADQPRYDPFEASSFFADGQSARQPLPDTVARGQLRDDALLTTGKEGGQDATRFPFPVTHE